MRHLFVAAFGITISILISHHAYATTLKWASKSDALTFDPHAINEGPTVAANGMVYEALVTRDASLMLQPELAQSWSLTNEGWIFTLRQGVKFHDGSDFNADDVVFSLERSKSDTSGFKNQLADVVEIEALDDYKVLLRTKQPSPILLNQLTNIFIMDRDWSQTYDVTEPQNLSDNKINHAVSHANGTGPYKLTRRKIDDVTIMEAHSDWWGQSQYPERPTRLEYYPTQNDNTRLARLLSGEVDLLLDPAPQDIARLETTADINIQTTPQLRTIFFGLNQGAAELNSSSVKGKNPFQDVKVREAMNLAIDRKAISRVIMDGLSSPTSMLVAPNVAGSTQDLDMPLDYDIETAQQLMRDAGYADGFDVQLDCPNDRYQNDEKICVAVVNMLSRINIDVTLDSVSKSLHFPKLQSKSSDFYLLGFGVPTLDSHFVLSLLVAGDGFWNATGYDNPVVNEKIAALNSELDLEKREQMMQEIWQIVKADMPYIPLHHQTIAWATREHVDIPISADNIFRPRFAVIKN